MAELRKRVLYNPGAYHKQNIIKMITVDKFHIYISSHIQKKIFFFFMCFGNHKMIDLLFFIFKPKPPQNVGTKFETKKYYCILQQWLSWKNDIKYSR